MSLSDQRLSNRQIATLRHLAICTSNGGQITLTREQREAQHLTDAVLAGSPRQTFETAALSAPPSPQDRSGA